jgi:hypothetical protein
MTSQLCNHIDLFIIVETLSRFNTISVVSGC